MQVWQGKLVHDFKMRENFFPERLEMVQAYLARGPVKKRAGLLRGRRPAPPVPSFQTPFL